MTIGGTLQERVDRLEAQLSEAQRRLSQVDARPANVPPAYNGVWLATLDLTLVAGGSTTASLHYYDGTTITDTGTNVTVYDWLLASSHQLTTGTQVIVEHFPDNRWYVTGGAQKITSPEEFVSFGTSVELTAVLDPGGSATAITLRWSGTYDATGVSVTVYDAFNRNFGLSGERFHVRQHPDSGRWEILGSQGLIRQGKASTTITNNGTGDVDIWTGNPLANASKTVTAHLKHHTGGTNVSNGKEVSIIYMPDAQIWRVMWAECE